MSENMYPDMIATVDDRIRLMWHRDWHPGEYIYGTWGSLHPFQTMQGQITQNEVIYMEVGLGLEIGIEKVLNKVDQSDIYPNPSNGIVHLVVQVFEDIEAQIYITDISGKVIYEYNGSKLHFGRNVIDMNLNHLIDGMYFINIKTAKGVVLTEKVIIN